MSVQAGFGEFVSTADGRRAVTATGLTLGLMAALLGATAAPAAAGDVPDAGSGTAGPAGAAAEACPSDQLAIGFDGTEAATGHRSLVLTFTNTGDVSCEVTGYASVDLHDRNGVFLAHAAESLSGFMYQGPAAVPVVSLAPGEVASAVVEGLAWTDESGSNCLPYATLTVAPPSGGEPSTFDWAGGACGRLQIHPVVFGPSPYRPLS